MIRLIKVPVEEIETNNSVDWSLHIANEENKTVKCL